MSGTIVPALGNAQQAEVNWVTSATGLSAADLARKTGAPFVGSDYSEMIASDEVDAIVSATRHNLGTTIAVAALDAGKSIHIEKPLALTIDDLRKVAASMDRSEAKLMVGFNRRFAPLIKNLKHHFIDSNTPLSMSYRVNAGWIEPSVWVHDPVEGGGRILGEVCHFIDLLQHICDSPPIRVHAARIRPDNQTVLPDENVQVIINFANGSSGVVTYSALGSQAQPKEYLEVMGGGKSATLNDFKQLTMYGNSTHTIKNKYGDKGHVKQFQLFVDSILSGAPAPIAPNELIGSTLATLAVPVSLENGQPTNIDIQNIELTTAGLVEIS
jgi:predicted dehydrogenase